MTNGSDASTVFTPHRRNECQILEMSKGLIALNPPEKNSVSRWLVVRLALLENFVVDGGRDEFRAESCKKSSLAYLDN